MLPALLRVGVIVAVLVGSTPALAVTTEPCARPALDASTWDTFNASVFRLRVPPGYHRARAQGIDSEVGSWERGGARFHFDFGAYSNKLASLEGVQAVRRCEATIHGWRATVVTARDSAGGWIAAANWEERGPATYRTSLTIYGVAPDSGAQAELLAMLWSVQFDGPRP